MIEENVQWLLKDMNLMVNVEYWFDDYIQL